MLRFMSYESLIVEIINTLTNRNPEALRSSQFMQKITTRLEYEPEWIFFFTKQIQVLNENEIFDVWRILNFYFTIVLHVYFDRISCNDVSKLCDFKNKVRKNFSPLTDKRQGRRAGNFLNQPHHSRSLTIIIYDPSGG